MSRRYDSYAPNDRGGSTTLAGPAARCGHSAREQKRAGADQAVRRGRPGWWAALRTANRRRARRGRASRERLPSKRAGAPRSAVPRCLGATPTGGQAAPSGARERDAGGAGCPKGSRNWPWGERDGGRAIEERCGRPSAGQSVACLARRLALSQVSRHLQRKRHAPSAGLGAKGRWGSWKEEAHLAVGSDVGCNDVELLLKAHLYPPSAPSQTQPAPHARTGKRDQGRD